MVAALRTKRKNWPVPLTTHIPAAPTPAPAAAPDTSAADAAAAAKKKAAAEREVRGYCGRGRGKEGGHRASVRVREKKPPQDGRYARYGR